MASSGTGEFKEWFKNQASGLLPELEAVAWEAGSAIMQVYQAQEAIQVETKMDDSPLTQADRASHRIILERLAELTPDIPVLSEESVLPPFEERQGWHRYWLVDPLDGTKEFINRNGEFTVNIALIDQPVPVLGLVYVPVTQVLYGGVAGQGAWRVEGAERRPIRARSLVPGEPLRVVASRRHGAEALQALLDKAAARFAQLELVNVGSSLKLCLLAEGKADWYPRLAPTSEWDTAAAQAVLEAAGGILIDEQGQPLRYNRQDSVLNPFFHGLADPAFDWASVLGLPADH